MRSPPPSYRVLSDFAKQADDKPLSRRQFKVIQRFLGIKSLVSKTAETTIEPMIDTLAGLGKWKLMGSMFQCLSPIASVRAAEHLANLAAGQLLPAPAMDIVPVLATRMGANIHEECQAFERVRALSSNYKPTPPTIDYISRNLGMLHWLLDHLPENHPSIKPIVSQACIDIKPVSSCLDTAARESWEWLSTLGVKNQLSDVASTTKRDPVLDTNKPRM